MEQKNRAVTSLSIQQLIGTGNCQKRREYISFNLLRNDEISNFHSELLKLQGNHMGKPDVHKVIEDYIYQNSKREWYKMGSQYEIILAEEAAYHKRLASFFIGKSVTARNLPWSFSLKTTTDPTEHVEIYGHVHAVIKENDRYNALILSNSTPKYSSRASLNKNKPSYAPELIAAYLGLSHMFGKNMKVSLVYDRHKEDSVGSEFHPAAQYLTADFSNLSEQELRSRLLEYTLNGKEPFDCLKCGFFSICSGMQLPIKEECEVFNDSIRKKPCFTDNQRKVVNFLDGTCAVYAVPGAGKTTALVYRLLNLLDSGIDPKEILFITFTNKACEEIKSRIKNRLNTEFDEELPEIYTYNGLGWQILRDHREIVGDLKLLTPIDEKQILIECIDLFKEPLKGYSYRYIEGPYGLLSSLLGSFKRLTADASKETSNLYANGHDPEQVCRLKAIYENRIIEEKYIDFDQQITLARDLLLEHTDILQSYGKKWRYIMADEYQDSSKENVELLYLIADSGQKNLVVVGDTDQSIYEWRNGSPKYLLEFDKHYPNCQKIYMNDNFRSVRQILEASNVLISKNENRIDMFMVAHKDSNAMPYRIRNCYIAQIPSLLELLLKKNYSYGDVAILSRNNAPLHKVKEMLDKLGIESLSPADELANEPFYILVKDILDMFFLGFSSTDFAFFRYMLISGCKLPEKKDPNLSYYHNLVTFYDVVPILANDTLTMLTYGIEEDTEKENDPIYLAFKRLYYIFLELLRIKEPKEYLQLLFRLFHIDSDAPAVTELLRIMDFQDFRTLEQFWGYLNLMEELNDNHKIERIPTSEKVNLMTAHSSKGKEFPVVILLQTEDYGDTEEERRLFYVAMTRAKKCLFALESPGNECHFLNEITDYMQTLQLS